MSTHPRDDVGFTRAFLASEAASGVLLMLCALMALLVANSPMAPGYFALLHREFGRLSVLHWINDALMAGFFLLVGLEIKRELLAGQLRTWSLRALPGIAALGGMVAPALVYLAFNLGDDGAPRGWAIPAATDIAFALGVLALLGPRVPVSLKLFLTALAVLDDLGAVIIIALFYTAQLQPLALLGAGAALALLIALNRFAVRHTGPYLAVGIVLWIFVHQSGVHATLAGVALAMCIPLRGEHAPLPRLEHALHPWIGFFVIPLFGFANAGVALQGMSLADLGSAVPLGVALGLFIGKQLGVFGAAWVAIHSGIARLPEGATWRQLYGTAVLCGIGFTMSLFIGALAFDAPALQEQTKIGVLLGSLTSALVASALLRASRRS